MINLKKMIHSHMKLLIFIVVIIIVLVFIFNRKLSFNEVVKRLDRAKTIELTIKETNGGKSVKVKKKITNESEVREIGTFLSNSMIKYSGEVWTTLELSHFIKTYTLKFLDERGTCILKIEIIDDNCHPLEVYINGYYYKGTIKNGNKLFKMLEKA